MSERRNYRRFPKGQTCEQCPSKRWYSEDGRRYCDRGHEIEGFVERGFEDEDAFGQTGHVARKEKEARERVSRTLSGNASRELYLHCLQLVLRKQLFWLVRDRGLPLELETVVRDLWALRTRNIAGLKTVTDAMREEDESENEETEAGGPGLGSGTETDTPELKMYSSEGSGAESDGGLSDAASATTVSTRVARSWSTDISSKRSLPTLIDTLALCYLGTLMMRLPIRVGDLFAWARNNQITYLDAIQEMPKEMRARLPSRYQRVLSARVSPFSGGELHEAVRQLAESFNANYKLKFPPLNEPLLLLRYARELALPIEVYAFVQGMIEFLNVDFTFPLEQRRVKLLDHPDVFLVACTVLATKLLCPFDGGERFAESAAPPLTGIDWDAWRQNFVESEAKTLSRRDLEKLGSEEAWTLDGTKTDEYLDWYQQAKVDERRPNGAYFASTDAHVVDTTTLFSLSFLCS
ncbi:hypothetical protein MAPG_00514 [Magnaporthiopsis poae ATCC 64411]|uniref:Uncharacterized protein n=1 Tax=Magnaporthiopsis poae (strain ATCC 64411 / 73-15) TaxID=644358 RepID=A0A0C4DL74_MAGP6|nr:hypothetical protein MAPG_00514 [Magnaporthiopsis poae ATCC 64411]